jgi:cytochrome c5
MDEAGYTSRAALERDEHRRRSSPRRRWITCIARRSRRPARPMACWTPSATCALDAGEMAPGGPRGDAEPRQRLPGAGAFPGGGRPARMPTLASLPHVTRPGPVARAARFLARARAERPRTPPVTRRCVAQARGAQGNESEVWGQWPQGCRASGATGIPNTGEARSMADSWAPEEPAVSTPVVTARNDSVTGPTALRRSSPSGHASRHHPGHRACPAAAAGVRSPAGGAREIAAHSATARAPPPRPEALHGCGRSRRPGQP